MMPELFRNGSLSIFIWSNEGVPLEPIHIHIGYGDASNDSDKFWLSKDGYFVPDKSNKCIKQKVAQKLIDSFILVGGIGNLTEMWISKFGVDNVCYFDA